MYYCMVLFFFVDFVDFDYLSKVCFCCVLESERLRERERETAN